MFKKAVMIEDFSCFFLDESQSDYLSIMEIKSSSSKNEKQKNEKSCWNYLSFVLFNFLPDPFYFRSLCVFEIFKNSKKTHIFLVGGGVGLMYFLFIKIDEIIW